MKCIQIPANLFGKVKPGEPTLVIRRVSDDVAFDRVHRGDWKYATRKAWKIAGRKFGIGLA